MRVPVSEKNQVLRKIGLAKVGHNYHGTIYGRAKIDRAKAKLRDNGFEFARNIGVGFSDEITAVHIHPEHPSIELWAHGDYSGMHVEPGKGYTYCTM